MLTNCLQQIGCSMNALCTRVLNMSGFLPGPTVTIIHTVSGAHTEGGMPLGFPLPHIVENYDVMITSTATISIDNSTVTGSLY